MRHTEAEQQEAREWLLHHLKPGMTVFTILRHVSKSGMSRVISLVIQTGEGMLNLDHTACKLLEGYDSRYEGCKAGGCGTDMGFHLVYNLAARLWPEGFGCTGEDCPSNDHTNGDRDYSPHLHESGGYALKQRWL